MLTLYELNSLVHDVIEDNFDEEYWVTGELSDVSTPACGGHFYGELVQKDEESDRIIARARITCWARIYNMLRLRFQKEAGETLRKGLQVKLLVQVNFHEQYGRHPARQPKPPLAASVETHRRHQQCHGRRLRRFLSSVRA